MGTCYSYNIFESKYLPQDLNVKDLPEFIPPVNSGRVVKVYDGDTITVASKIPNLKNSKIYKFSNTQISKNNSFENGSIIFLVLFEAFW